VGHGRRLHRDDSSIDLIGTGPPCVVKGRVMSEGGTPFRIADFDIVLQPES
jgi:hypothetical protein